MSRMRPKVIKRFSVVGGRGSFVIRAMEHPCPPWPSRRMGDVTPRGNLGDPNRPTPLARKAGTDRRAVASARGRWPRAWRTARRSVSGSPTPLRLPQLARRRAGAGGRGAALAAYATATRLTRLRQVTNQRSSRLAEEDPHELTVEPPAPAQGFGRVGARGRALRAYSLSFM